MQPQKFIAKSPNDLSLIVPDLLSALGDSRVCCLDAPMGAGKTTLVGSIMRFLGSPSVINSPTFAIINDYALPDGNSVYHFDLYRLQTVEEAVSMGFDEYFYSGSYCFVEWPEVADSLYPDNAKRITIEVLPDGSRSITISDY